MAVKAKAEITISRIVDVEKVTTYYLLQSSTAAAPSKPADGSAIGSNWSKTEPSYSSGSTMTLYFVTQTVLSNGTIKYSEVSKSSSYEAAKEAWNKANSAQNTANSANGKVNGLRVGGRNLLQKYIRSGDKTSKIDELSIKVGVGRVGDTYFYLKTWSKLQKGETYTISCDASNVPSGASNWTFGVRAQNTTFVLNINKNGRCYGTGVLDADVDANTEIIIDDKERPYTTPPSIILSNFKLEKGNVATDWTPAPEDAMDSVYNEYYLSTSQTSLSGGSWSTTAPTWVNGKYMWSRTVTVDGAGNKTYSPSQNGVCIAGATGATGATGPQGPTGNGIKSATIQYQLSDSRTTAPTGTWLNSPPATDIAKPYLWTRTVLTYTNGSTSTSYGVSSTFDSLRVGGRNLLKGSHKSEVMYDYPSNDYEDYASWRTSIPLNGDTYTLSFWAKSTANGDVIRVHFYSPSNITSIKGSQGQNSNHSDGLCDFILTTTLTKYWVTYTIPKGGNSERSVIIPRLGPRVGVVGKGTITILWEKLEEGNIATDWTPAPEDIESRVTAAETNISNNTKQIELKAYKTEVKQISLDLNAYKDTTTKFIQDTNGWELNWETLIRTDEADIANHTDYITFKNGDILLGDSASITKMQISKEKVQIKEGADVVATFGSTTRIGKESNRNAVVDQNGFKVYNATEIIAQLGYGNAKNKDGNTEYFPYYTIGIRKADSAVGGYSNADGYNVVASGWCAHVEGNESQSTNYASHAEGYKTVSSNQASHAEGQETTASGFVSHAEGHLTKATESYSHAEGNSTEASGFASHAEGDSTSASGAYAHAEGCNTYTGDVAAHAEGSGSSANGAYSHAEGFNTTAKGQASHAGGIGTVAKENFQTAIGTYNADSKDALLIVGNGSDANNRKNAFTVLSTGNAKVAGVMEAGNGFMSQNNQAYFGKYADGSGAVMMHMGPDNNQYVGYGNFISKKGGLILQGGTIQFNVSSPKNLGWFPYYKPGDTYTVNYKGGAFITNSGTNVIFTIPIDKPLINVSTVTITSTNGLMIRQNGKYLYGSSGSAFAKPSSYSAVVYSNVIVITAVMGNTTNVTNNDGCGIDAQIKVTFS